MRHLLRIDGLAADFDTGQPELVDHPDQLGQPRYYIWVIRRPQHSSGRKYFDQLTEAVKAARAHLDPAAVELGVATQQCDQLTVDEAILPADRKCVIEHSPHIGLRGHAVAG